MWPNLQLSSTISVTSEKTIRHSSDSIRSLNYDNISSIRIKEHPKETDGMSCDAFSWFYPVLCCLICLKLWCWTNSFTVLLCLRGHQQLAMQCGFYSLLKAVWQHVFVFNCSIYSVWWVVVSSTFRVTHRHHFSVICLSICPSVTLLLYQDNFCCSVPILMKFQNNVP